jgi:hypothetical protein
MRTDVGTQRVNHRIRCFPRSRESTQDSGLRETGPATAAVIKSAARERMEGSAA